MKKFKLLIFLLLVGTIGIKAQMTGSFVWFNDGHLYFTATNQTTSNLSVRLVAVSEYNDIVRSETVVVQAGGGIYLGPTTPWRWYWHSGDKIYLTYPNGVTVFWTCNTTESAPVYPSFQGKHCTGTVGCDCPGFEPITDGKEWEKAYCKHCGHKKSCHK